MSKGTEKLDEIIDAVQNVQEMVSHLSEQIGRLHESATHAEVGPGGREAPYSLPDIGNMLAALHIIFEPQLKAKAFEILDGEYEHAKARRDVSSELVQAALMVALIHRLGVLPGTLDRFYKEWKTQRSMK
jgi:hypothetical protein